MSVIAFVQSKDNVSLDSVARDGIEINSNPDENTKTIQEVLEIKNSIPKKIFHRKRKLPIYKPYKRYRFYCDFHPENDDAGRKRIYTIFWDDNTPEELIIKTAELIGVKNFSPNQIQKKSHHLSLSIAVIIFVLITIIVSYRIYRN